MPPEPAPAGGDPAPADCGLFGPASVTWRVMAEPVLWAAAFRALYLQALHPRVMRGTWQHTAFADPGQAWGTVPAHCGVRPGAHLRQPRGGGTGRAPGPQTARLAARHRPRRHPVPPGRAGTPALGALCRDRFLRR